MTRCTYPLCGRRDPDTGQRHPRRTTHGRTLCDSHAALLTRDLAEIPDMWAILPSLLDAATAAATRTDDKVRARKASAPTPARLDVIALLDPRTTTTTPDDIVGIPDMLDRWADWVHTATGATLDAPADRAGRGLIVMAVRLLTSKLGWITRQDRAGEFLTEITRAHDQLAEATGSRRGARAAPCHLPDRHDPARLCGGDILLREREPDDPEIRDQGPDDLRSTTWLECNRCHTRWTTPHDRARLTLILTAVR